MHSEHEVRHEPEVVLAVSVLTPREKLFLIKTAAARLEAIGRGRAPDLSTSFLDRLEAGGPLQGGPARTGGPVAVRPPGAQSRGGGPRPPQPRARAPQLLAPPRQLSANSSISISKVDMTRPCNMCSIMLPSPAALVEHMNQNHFRGLAGVNIVSQGGAAPSSPAPRSLPPGLSASTSPRPSTTAPRPPVLTPSQARNMSLTRGSPSPRPPTSGRPPTTGQVRPAPGAPTPPPSKVARLQGISLTRPGGRPPTQGLPVRGFKASPAQAPPPPQGEDEIRKEVEGLQTLELLDNLVNFLNE